MKVLKEVKQAKAKAKSDEAEQKHIENMQKEEELAKKYKVVGDKIELAE